MESKNATITVQTSIKADMNTVRELRTNPKHITNWNFATKEWCCPAATNVLKPGGVFCWRMEAKDGSVGFDFTGAYDKVIEKELITYKMSYGRLVKINFLENGNESIVKETFNIEGIYANEQQRAGWQAILENFKTYVESTKQ
ncbi:SRPBCC domain-containing protein [Lacinutrix neustonica]|uniref:SRPBCC domain-containing protein n=1 Tax=Lacinutrix neustonica TaxID=2980107 RepID=A0A9E8MV31_9FLAO|nr:SRPBCC domain-containing protein [Lacinutrix neustonica]WAC02122.1 SRPBCC domain-containing protein [Lacinutrix neustonica]